MSSLILQDYYSVRVIPDGCVKVTDGHGVLSNCRLQTSNCLPILKDIFRKHFFHLEKRSHVRLESHDSTILSSDLHQKSLGLQLQNINFSLLAIVQRQKCADLNLLSFELPLLSFEQPLLSID